MDVRDRAIFHHDGVSDLAPLDAATRRSRRRGRSSGDRRSPILTDHERTREHAVGHLGAARNDDRSIDRGRVVDLAVGDRLDGRRA